MKPAKPICALLPRIPLLQLTAALGLTAWLVTWCFGVSKDQTATTKAPNNAYYLSCGEKEHYSSHTARSPVLVSPAGKYSAYVEVKANWVDGQCVNTSKVLVQNNSDPYQIVFLQEPTEMQMGNGIRLIDWSRNSNSLLFEVQQWGWLSDAGLSHEVQIYDAVPGVFKTVPLEHEIANLGDGCLVTVQPLGFSETGEAVLRFSAKQYFEPEGEARKPACTAKQGVWIFDPKSNRLKNAPSNYQVQRWGKAK